MTAIDNLIARAKTLSADSLECLADHLAPLFATPAGGLALLRLAAERDFQAASTSLAVFERDCDTAEDPISAEIVASMLRDIDLRRSAPTYRSVTVPTYGGFTATRLVEGRLADGRSTGLCATVSEATERAAALLAGAEVTVAPRGQASRREMLAAWTEMQTLVLRDGGLCRAAIERAVDVGIHTVEWAIASRYLVAGWVRCSV